ncbi:MAG: DUF5989 family protein [Planctomycetota bacterium]|jgi:hypothetical protein
MHTRADTDVTKPERPPALPARRGWFRRLFADIFFVTKRDRKWWLLPLIILLLILALVTVIAALAGPLAPFVYPVL